MINFEVKGAIFDVDDTLLDNKPGIPGYGLHERSRLDAFREAGKRHGIKELEDISVEDNLDAFVTAPAHTIESAVWNFFVKKGIADSDTINPEDPLLLEIVARKHELYKVILMEEGEEVLGAAQFIQKLASKRGLEDKMAIASTGIRPDIDVFIAKDGLTRYFPSNRIKTKENITHPKPNPEVFNLAFDSLELPELDRLSVCAFEDDPRGIMSAKAAGLYVCAIETRFSNKELMALEIPPHITASSYAEFEKIFGL
jgi:beta-phosphoglucomutase-like phosphatase (HAD superfamily)